MADIYRSIGVVGKYLPEEFFFGVMIHIIVTNHDDPSVVRRTHQYIYIYFPKLLEENQVKKIPTVHTGENLAANSWGWTRGRLKDRFGEEPE